jgi:hypothetical protein
MRPAAWLAGCLLTGYSGAAAADPGVSIRTGEHEHYSRIVFVLPPDAGFSLDRDGASVKLHFAGAGEVPGLPGSKRVQSVQGGAGVATVVPMAGKTCRVWRTGNRVVVDVLDASQQSPGSTRAAEAAPAPAASGVATHTTAKATPGLRVGVVPTRILAHQVLRAGAPLAMPPADSVPAVAAQEVLAAPPAAVSPVQAAALPLPGAQPAGAEPRTLAQKSAEQTTGSEPAARPPSASAAAAPAAPYFAAALLPQDADWPNGAVLFPFPADVGAVAFRRGGEGHVVFDAAQPVDLGVLRNDPTYGSAAVSLLPSGTHFHMPLSNALQLRLQRSSDGWRVGIVPQRAGGFAIEANAGGGVLKLTAKAPSHIIVIDDPATGGRLLAGTQRASGQAWPVAYASAEFSLLPTWQGVLVQPVSDRAVLSVTKDGFALSAEGAPALAMPPMREAGQTMADSLSMTRRFDFPSLPEPLIRNRLHQDQQDAAAAPRLGRFAPRIRAAQAMLALGMDVEARSLLNAATADDPAGMRDPDAAALGAIADWLAARGDPAARDGVDDQRLNGSDEIALWRAVLHGNDQDPAPPAAALASTWKLVLSYPDPLRRRLLPAIADILARGKQTAALRDMVEAVPDHLLDAARAALLQADGKTDAALAAWGVLAASSDRLQAAQARRARTDLLLASHRIDAKAAADQLEQQLYAWRGGGTELDLRLKLADLRGQSGDWRAGLALLRATEPLYPEARDRLRSAERALVAGLLSGPSAARMAPLDLVAIAEEFTDLLTEVGGEAKLAPVLADKLLALDLPARAEPILQRMLDQTSDPTAKAQLGLRLSALRLDLHGTKAAVETLDATDSPDLPHDVVADRLVARARALAAGGDAEAALHLLDAPDTQAGLELRASLEEKQRNWPAAEAAIEALVKRTVSPDGPLDPARQDLLVRLASVASQAGDMAALRRLHSEQAGRIAPGPRADLFNLLTQSPVGVVGDLPRSAMELSSARAVPAALASFQPR